MNIWRIAMAHVERRERRGKNGQVVRSYRVHWRGPDGKERNKSFKRKVNDDELATIRGIVATSYAYASGQPPYTAVT